MNSNIPGGIIQGELPNEVLNFIKNKLKPNYKILNISNVKTQIVSGIMYYFDVKILNSTNCQINKYSVSIWAQPWMSPPYKIQKIISQP